MRHLSFSLFLASLISCAPLQEIPSQQAIQGAAVGAAATAAVDKAKEVLTPVYPLYLAPAEICRPEGDGVTCVAVPCAPDAVCQIEYESLEHFFESVQSVVPVSRLGDWLGAASEFCHKHEGLCIQEVGKYEGKKFMLMKEDR